MNNHNLPTFVLAGKRFITGLGLVFIAFLAYRFLIRRYVDDDDIVMTLLALWLLTAYYTLPRLYRLVSKLYLPDYFIGRVRTTDGLLGDPVNLALIGRERDLRRSMEAAGWTRADELNLKSSLKMIRSTLFRRSYSHAPVSPLFLFGRKQDLAYQREINGSPAKRHHVRFWKTPRGWKLPGGFDADWLAAGTFDRRVGISFFTLQITHKIAEDTDRERDFIIETLQSTGQVKELTLIEDYSSGYHSRNGGGDAIMTDGSMPFVKLRI